MGICTILDALSWDQLNNFLRIWWGYVTDKWLGCKVKKVFDLSFTAICGLLA